MPDAAEGRPLFVAVGGNIASGKTTLAAALGTSLGVPPFLEDPDANPWFGKEGQDFQAEVRFLLDAAEATRASAAHGAVLDRSIQEHVAIFASVKHQHGLIAKGELDLLQAAGKLLSDALPLPQLVVTLHAPTDELLRRISNRGRQPESGITAEFLDALADRYDQLWSSWTACPLVPIDTGRLDVRRSEDIELITRKIRTELSLP